MARICSTNPLYPRILQYPIYIGMEANCNIVNAREVAHQIRESANARALAGGRINTLYDLTPETHMAEILMDFASAYYFAMGDKSRWEVLMDFSRRLMEVRDAH